MRRKIFLPLVLTALFLLTACGGGGTASEDGDSAANGPSRSVPSVSDSGEGVDLDADDLAYYTEFLNRSDVYGFLLSDYDDVLDADLYQVFYDGAGVASETEDWMREAFDPDGAGDVTWVTAEAMDAVLKARTNYGLEEYLEHGNGIVYHLDEEEDFFNVHGDTNWILVEAVAGVRYPDGSVRVDSSDGEGEDPDTFTTVLLEQDDGDPLIYCNQITGGLLAWALEQRTLGSGYTSMAAEAPPFDGYYYIGQGMTETLPVTLDLSSERENGGSDPAAWMSDHWNDWMLDPAFAAAQGDAGGQIRDADEFFLYRAEDGIYDGQALGVWYREDGTPFLSADLTAFLFPDDADKESRGPSTAQSVRWARYLNARLILANWSDMGTDRDGYLTALDWGDGDLTALDRVDLKVLWRTDPGACRSRDFEVLGVFDGTSVDEGVLICGGATGEGNYLYQISLDTGEVLDRTEIASPADWLVHANGTLYVHCWDRDYEFAVSYG